MRWWRRRKRAFRAGIAALRCWLLIVLILAVQWPGAASASLHERQPELRSIDTIAQAHGRQVKVRGAVTLLTPHFFVIEDESGAIEVQPTSGGDLLSIGDEVEVTGSAIPAPRPTLRGTVQRLWSGSAPLAGVLTPDMAADGQHELSLVNLQGQLVSAATTPSDILVLTLEGEHQFFTASLPDPSRSSERWPTAAALRRALQAGTTLQVTGVLDAVPPARGAQGSFTLALRSTEDIVQLAGPPWWTPAHLIASFLALAALGLALFAWHVRNLRLRFRAVTEERLRIARDIHDTMAQGFAGIALQLQAAEQTLPAGAEDTRRHLGLALGMVRYSRSESHRSIQMLRSLAASNSLTVMLEQTARQAGEGSPVRIEVTVCGHEPALPYDTAIQLYRIGQEAIANAVQHAAASTIHLLLDFRKNAIALTVTDDGRGFDVANQRRGEHFGLAGIHERIEGMHGSFDLQSSSSGSRLSVAVPWPA